MVERDVLIEKTDRRIKRNKGDNERIDRKRKASTPL